MNNIIKLSPDDKLNLNKCKSIDTETWGQEQWSKENPMDYINAVKIINSFPVQNSHEIFKQIFAITRLHLPKTLYKFYSITEDMSLNKVKLKTLEEKKVYLSEISQFNDPFDGRAVFVNRKLVLPHNRLFKS